MADRSDVPPASTLVAGIVRLPRRALVLAVKIYRLLLSPWLGNSCRFQPTCSVYAIEALERHGAVLGSGLTGYRLLRCHPWCTPGLDPVPEHPLRLFTALLSQPNSKKPVP